MDHEALIYAHSDGHSDVCYTENGKSFVTVGADGDLRIWSNESSEDPVHQCVGEWALCVRQKKDKLYVATSSNDVQILRLPDGERDGILGRYVAPINHIAVGKNKDLFTLAGEDMEVKLVGMQGNTTKIYKGDNVKGPFLSVALSPDCQFLAASSGDGKLRVWDVESQDSLAELEVFPKTNSFSNATVLCRIDFHPKNGQLLAYPKDNSVVLLNSSDWTESSKLTCESNIILSIVQFSPCGQFIAATSTKGDFIFWEVTSEKIVGQTRHSDGLGIVSFCWNPLNNGQIVYVDSEGQLSKINNCIKVSKETSKEPEEELEDIEDEPEDINELITMAAEAADSNGGFDEVPEMDDDDEDNENAISVEKLKRQFMMGDEDEDISKAGSRVASPRPRTPEVPLQDAFMPSSTPEHLDPRYLCWNDVGVIRSFGNRSEEDEGVNKSIEVEFHDSSFHNSIMMANYMDFTMAALSRGAVIVANTNQIKVIPLAATTKEWILKLEEPEEVVLVASSDNIVAFATTNYLIRIATIFGIQRGIVRVSGPLVCMAAYKHQLLVAYHSAGVRGNDQCINIKLFVFDGLTLASKDLGCSLSPESHLRWLGFSDVGTPGMMDSSGMLSMFAMSSNTWIPFCDTTKHRISPADGFFVTALFESYQSLAGIRCKGAIYPSFTPRPTVSELPLAPPFAESSTDKTELEANLFTWSNLLVNEVDKKFKEAALKTFALACRNDLDQRAVEFMEMLSNPQVISLGIKYASKLQKMRMVEKLMEIAAGIEASGEEEVENSKAQAENTPETKVIKPNRKLTLSTARKRALQQEAASKDNNIINEAVPSPINTQESLFSTQELQEAPKNPFLKKLKMPAFPAVNSGKDKELAEKRKLSDSETTTPKEKQRKLNFN